jgi:hypothetical protein
MNHTKADDFVDEKDSAGTGVHPVGDVLEPEPLILTPEDDKRIQRRIDWNLMPILAVVVGFNFVSPSDLVLKSRAAVLKSQARQNLHVLRIGHGFPEGYWTESCPICLARKYRL